MKWSRVQVGSRFSWKIPTAIRSSCSSRRNERPRSLLRDDEVDDQRPLGRRQSRQHARVGEVRQRLRLCFRPGVITGGTEDKTTPNGGKVYAGYLRGKWGLEFGYYYLGNREIENAGGQVQDEMETTAIVVAGVFQTPIAQGFDFVARAGVAFTNAEYDCKLSCGTMPFVDTKTTSTSGMWGIGVNMRMTRSLSFLLEYEHIGSVHHNVGNIEFQDGYTMYSVGARLQF